MSKGNNHKKFPKVSNRNNYNKQSKPSDESMEKDSLFGIPI
ncbi:MULTISPECIES: hypothetical protein [unclassified Clostridium]|nr:MULTISPECIES: hypothetical protein [unclassified Clostridium]